MGNTHRDGRMRVAKSPVACSQAHGPHFVRPECYRTALTHACPRLETQPCVIDDAFLAVRLSSTAFRVGRGSDSSIVAGASPGPRCCPTTFDRSRV